MKLHRMFGTIIFILVLTNVNAQNERQLAAKILTTANANLVTAHSLSMRVTHKFYSSHQETVPSDVYNGFYKRSKLRVHSVLMGIENIEGKNLKLTIDTTNSTVIVNKQKTVNLPIPDLDNSLSFCSNVLVSKKDSLSSEIQLLFESGKYPMDKIVFEIKNNIIVKLTLYHSESTENEEGKLIKPKTEIVFTEVEINKNIPGSEFEISNIIKENGKEFQLTTKYSNYKLINLIPNN